MRRVAVTIVVITASLLGAVPALAGAWAVTTVTEMPDIFVPGETHDVAFEIRQHGTRLVTDLRGVMVVLRRTDGPAERRTFPAAVSGTTWHAAVETPREGAWTWRIQPGGFDAVEMGELVTGVAPSPTPVELPRLFVGSMLAVAGALVLLRRREPQPSAA